MDYVIQGKLDNTIHEISYNQIYKMFKDNEKEETEGNLITLSSYRGENYYDGINDRMAFFKEYLLRDPKTAGYKTYYPHGIVIEQSMRRNYYRGENRLYPESVPTLLRNLKKYTTIQEKELYRMVADMRIAEFKALLNKFDHVKNWKYSDVLYEVLAQHYGLETGWLDITNDFNVALFFATCYWKDGDWHPLSQEMIDNDYRYGMIFHMPSYQMPMRMSSAINSFTTYYSEYINGKCVNKKKDLPSIAKEFNLIFPLGFQPFMRCHMQSGYGIYMREPYALQQDNHFEKLKFKQNARLSQRVYDLMDGGRKIYPHEGLNQAQFIIDEIRNLTTFSQEAFEYALYRNHHYRIVDREICLRDLNGFSINGNSIKITNKHPWNLSSRRRKRIDEIYKNFSLEKNYGISIIQRSSYPGPQAVYEPWMLRSAADEPGTIDFKLRDHIDCGDDFLRRNYMTLLMTLCTAKLQDF